MRDQVQLIAYADRFGGSLPRPAPAAGRAAGRGLRRRARPAFLPAVRRGGRRLRPGRPPGRRPAPGHLGRTCAALARGRDVVADLIVNHVSDRSGQFRDVVERGDARRTRACSSPTTGSSRPAPPRRTCCASSGPRPGLPFTRSTLGGRPRLLWTTFTPHQIDLDVHDPGARVVPLARCSAAWPSCGVTMVRLDAVGYTVKTAGTSCFLTPETFAFVDDLAAEAHGLGLRVLAEVHAHHRHARARGGARRPGLRLRPRAARAARGVHRRRRPAAALAGRPAGERGDGARHPRRPRDDRRRTGRPGRRAALRRPDRGRRRANRRQQRRHERGQPASPSGGLPGQLHRLRRAGPRRPDATCWPGCCSCSCPGIPQVYYVGLLAGRNAAVRRRRPGDQPSPLHRGRRSTEALRQPVVAALLELIRLRNAHPAFAGEFTLPDAPTGSWSWRGGPATPAPSCGSISLIPRGR